ncbi:AAA family ATPase [Lysobacter sp. K5869]|uniref:ATP-binding protein n=1 Tax=Lysobacter sp. K5869 TaxID=2820808 RepID=UPI001C063806|nr:ATP-binding protein [Lysobacter sp. K5869]QWP75918.1 AAA family ATPase [Lysobacter sp. K5869]
MDQFCLLSYQDPSVAVPLFEANNRAKGTAVSVVIGPNGSGKSRVLSRVVDELSFVHERRSSTESKKRQPLPSERAALEYIFDGQRCRIERRGRDFEATVDGEFVGIEQMPFPARAMAISHLPTDKFRYAQSEPSDFYQYLGLRQATNLTTTGAVETKVLESLLSGMAEDDGFDSRLGAWLSLLGISPKVGVALTLSNRSLLTEDFASMKQRIELRMQRHGRLRSLSVKPDESLDPLWSFLSILPKTGWSKGPKGYELALDLSRFISSPDEADLWRQGIDLAKRVDVFRTVSPLFDKGDGPVRFSDLSSGEQHLIGTNVRLLARLKPRSLIVIDEPEISLHPEWQIKYIPTLLESLRKHSSSHVIIATHSHFMVSDLDRESSLVTARQEQGPKLSFFEGDVYGRSPENILYRVFGVATSGNSYVEGDLHSALMMLSGRKEMDKRELERIQTRLERVQSEDNPALGLILEQIGSAVAEAG